MNEMENILVVNNLQTSFSTDGGEVRAVDGVSFSVPKGKTVRRFLTVLSFHKEKQLVL